MIHETYPLISIVTPSYNQGSFLKATIESVLSQNYPNLEYIIIDGGSTDESVDIIRQYENHLYYWCSEKDEGQYHAINKGFSKSNGKIMGWINSDDMYLPWTFRTVANIMNELPEVKWLTTLKLGIWDYDGFCLGFTEVEGYSLSAFLDSYNLPVRFHNSIQQESTFWQREIWDQSGGYINTELSLASDFELWSRFYIENELYGTISPLAGFRYQYSQKSQNMDEYVKEAISCLQGLQQSLKWRFSVFRLILAFIRKHKLPMISKFILSNWGYDAKRVVRSNFNQPSASWQIEKYKF
ncbi:glycosyl transferase [Synechococcus sp. PCC 7502]|uniref:glycosyltransferase family 2 protein n=1 Tax=Synechococcus sp. PCC 7502 TaxID=1173263 RepID=UPI00029FEA1A|nr:glycosyltransferase family 2 protein [Synechococcus sp. PCC 7502]AFY75128.1 glycosyl transferase [Synechococcus sp. PCC 7502]